jgi:hypothetical protein
MKFIFYCLDPNRVMVLCTHKTPWVICSLLCLGFYVNLQSHQQNSHPRFEPSANDLGRARAFETIATKNTWKSGESVSGTGSEMNATVLVRECIGKWLLEYHVKTLNDICGDANWQRFIPGISSVDYQGYDISTSALVGARRKNLDTDFKFDKLDLVTNIPRVADMMLVRDVIQHLPHEMGLRALRNVIRSGTRYLVVSSYPGHANERDISSPGRFYKNNVFKPPFDVLGFIPLASCYNLKNKASRLYLIELQ